MIRLYGFGPGFGQPDLSPFVVKIMILLRMAGIPFEKVDGLANVRKAPRGKLPFIEENGRVISDSRLIRRHLEQVHAADFSGGYDEATRALGTLVERTLEESTYFIALHVRWVRATGWPVMERAAFASMPFPLRAVAGPIVRASVRKSTVGQGTGRLTDAENDLIAAENTRAVALTLGDKPYLLGERACGADATLLAFLLAASADVFPGALRNAILAEPNLVAYSTQLAADYLPECQGIAT